MAAAAYTTDLVTITTAEVSTTGWSEPTGATAGGTPAAETDYFIHGQGCISKTFNATGLGGLGYTPSLAQTLPLDGAVYIWQYYAAPNALATKANGGIRMAVGSSGSNYRSYYVAGSDTYTYGGWICYPVNPTVTPSATQGTPTSTLQFFGWIADSVNAVQKGNPFGVDAIRIGRGTLQATGGDLANGYATFDGMSTFNDHNDSLAGYNRYGIFQYNNGSYKFQGRLSFGSSATPVDFRDANKNIVIQNTQFVTANFNLFEVINPASRVDWTGLTISSLGTVSKGRFLATDSATINITSCAFADLDTFVFKPNTTVTSTAFRRCGQITPTGATMAHCLIETSPAPAAMVFNSPTDSSSVSQCDLRYNNTAIRITSPGTYVFDGHSFSSNTHDVENASSGLVVIEAINGCNVGTFINTGGGSTIIRGVVFLTLRFSASLIADSSATYKVFFTNDAAGDNLGYNFGTINAIIVNQSDGTPMSGYVNGQSSVTLAYDYTNNNQRGVTSAGTVAPVTAVAMGLSTAQYSIASGTITFAGPNSLILDSGLELNYVN